MEAKDRHQLMERQPSSIGISKSEAINELQWHFVTFSWLVGYFSPCFLWLLKSI
jgi:hypothetical protein